MAAFHVKPNVNAPSRAIMIRRDVAIINDRLCVVALQREQRLLYRPQTLLLKLRPIYARREFQNICGHYATSLNLRSLLLRWVRLESSSKIESTI